MHTTTRLGLQVPDASDNVSAFPGGPAATMATTLDRAVVASTSTVTSSRPAASTVPEWTVHRATDSNVVSVSDGTNWHFVSADSPGPSIGTVTDHLGTTDPIDIDGVVRWLILNGRSLLRATYPALFAVIGTAYGAADGSHFSLPNLGGRVTVAAGTGALVAAKSVGNTGGEETHALQPGEDSNGTPIRAGGTPWLGGGVAFGTSFSTAVVPYGNTIGESTGQPHNNMQPWFAMNKVVRAL